MPFSHGIQLIKNYIKKYLLKKLTLERIDVGDIYVYIFKVNKNKFVYKCNS